MTDQGQFGTNMPPAKAAASSFDCAAVEIQLAEFAENALPSAIAEQLHAHAAGCAACREKLAEARRGREWLLVLKHEPLEPPAGMVAKILARTSLAGIAIGADSVSAIPDRTGLKTGLKTVLDIARPDRATRAEIGHIPQDEIAQAGSSVPAWQRSSVVVLRRTLLEPRLALVAAMAFFSISLTLNLMGVRLTSLHASDLAPRNMHRAVTRQYAQANARVARYYENLRIVYEVEARVQQLRRAAATNTPSEPQAKPRKQSSDSSGDPSRDSSRGQAESERKRMATPPGVQENVRGNKTVTRPDPMPLVTGPRMDAAFRLPAQLLLVGEGHTLATSSASMLGTKVALQPALLAPSCSLRTICFSMRYFSARERRFA